MNMKTVKININMRTAMNSGLISLRPAECLKCLNGHGCLTSAALVCITEMARRRDADSETSHNAARSAILSHIASVQYRVKMDLHF